jgi:hypothetical protein
MLSTNNSVLLMCLHVKSTMLTPEFVNISILRIRINLLRVHSKIFSHFSLRSSLYTIVLCISQNYILYNYLILINSGL